MWPFTRKKKTPRASPSVGYLNARYDAAQTTAENIRHWAMADALSADASMSSEVRRTLRNRSRYEVANNSYAKGMILTMAGDCIGTGPRLQLQTSDSKNNRQVELDFERWAEKVDLAAKLRAMRMAKATDGEAFALLVNNLKLDHEVKLDIRLIEAERVTMPNVKYYPNAVNSIDGLEFDPYGNITHYYVLKNHPGNLSAKLEEFDRVPANSIIHWYRQERPEQHRGVPEITPALPLFAQLRRYTLAVLAAAETAADFAAVIYTDAPANGEAMPLDPMDVIPLEKRMATVLADGWKLGQIKAEQPATSYPEFKREILGEIGRCLQIPVNIVTGDSSRHNYASGRLDHQAYFKVLKIEQDHIALAVLDRIFDAWYREYELLNGQSQYLHYAPVTNGNGLSRRRGSVEPPARLRAWMWDGQEHVDPAKEANAQGTRLVNLTTNLATEYARQGKDWEIELRQIAKERALMQELNLTAIDPAKPEKPPDDEPNDDEEVTDDDIPENR
ncbi:MAG: phage portal protein [Planctomycetaceae bacterium]|nr:phage portal protein [Planctomycetaceae bacterium]